MSNLQFPFFLIKLRWWLLKAQENLSFPPLALSHHSKIHQYSCRRSLFFRYSCCFFLCDPQSTWCEQCSLYSLTFQRPLHRDLIVSESPQPAFTPPTQATTQWHNFLHCHRGESDALEGITSLVSHQGLWCDYCLPHFTEPRIAARRVERDS